MRALLAGVVLLLSLGCEPNRIRMAREGRACRMACPESCNRYAEDAGEWVGPVGDRRYQNYCDSTMHAREHCLRDCERLYPY